MASRDDLPAASLPVWMNKGEPLTLAHATRTWWQRVYDWLTFPLAQIDVDTCEEDLLSLLAYQRDIERFEGEPLSLFRLRVKHAFVNAQDAGGLAGFERIFQRLNIGELQQLERQINYDWDVILLRINDEQLSRDNALMMRLVRQYGRTCRRYFFDVLNNTPAPVYSGHFDNETCYWSARAILRPVSITSIPTALSLAPGDSVLVMVDVQPDDAEDRSFRAEVSDGTIATVTVVSGGVMVTAHARGEATVTLITNDRELTATLAVKVVSVTQFVIRVESADRPLFYVTNQADFTIDYGDGSDSTDYAFEAASTSSVGWWVFATRALTEGAEYTLTVKNSNTLRFYISSAVYTVNPLLEIIRVSGERTDMSHFVRDATELRGIHAGAFDDLPNVTLFNYAFYGCSRLTTIPAGLFDHTPLVTAFYGTFQACSSLTAIPAGLFDNTSLVTSFGSAFYGCSRLTAIPADLFDNTPLVTTFYGTFRDCSSLTAILADLFDNTPLVTAFYGTFQACSSLTAIPAGLFDNTPLVTSFGSAFYGCSRLTAIPAGLFDNTPLVTAFNSAFRGCSSLTAIPAGLFDNTPSVTTFYNAFYGCSRLAVIPADLFDNTPLVTSFGYTFHNCSNLTAIPAGLFDNTPLITAFSYTFGNCSSVTSNINAVLPLAEYRATDVSGMFSGCSGMTGSGVAFIQSMHHATLYSRALYGCTGLDDYDTLQAEFPDWVRSQ